MVRKTLFTAFQVVRRITENPANRGHRFGALARFATWQAYKRTFGRPYDARVWQGRARLRCYADSAIASAVLYARGGLADYNEMLFLRHYLRAGDNFLDIGANIGVYTLFAAAHTAPDGRVFSFEPGEVAGSRLRENVALNQLGARVLVYPVALSDRNGTLRFTRGRDATNQIEMDEGVDAIVVDTARLDDAVLDKNGKRPRFAAAKIDIEGAEPLALRGASEMLAAANPPVWIIEINGRLRGFGFEEGEFEDWLRARGYLLALYDGRSRELQKAPRAWMRENNVLAVHQAHWDQVIDRVSQS